MLRTFHIPINLDLNQRGSRKGHQPLQLGIPLFQICANFFLARAVTNKNKQHMVYSLFYVGKKKAKKTIIYSKICLRDGFQLIFIFQWCAGKYSYNCAVDLIKAKLFQKNCRGHLVRLAK